MILKSKNLDILFTENEETQQDSLFVDVDDLYNMSETRLYPKGLPLEMLFQLKREDEVVGEIKFNRIRWFNRKAEISLVIKKEYQKKGYGSEALYSVLNYAFNKMNLHRVEAEVIEYNKASIKLIRKFNFVEEGRLREAKYSDGKYWDIIRYGLLKKEFVSEDI
ncbi:MAG: GNAT family protein [Melioribacteraceae bacterium]|nr:GNAT family protein [Melioribacteraceae bacterium]